MAAAGRFRAWAKKFLAAAWPGLLPLAVTAGELVLLRPPLTEVATPVAVQILVTGLVGGVALSRRRPAGALLVAMSLPITYYGLISLAVLRLDLLVYGLLILGQGVRRLTGVAARKALQLPGVQNH